MSAAPILFGDHAQARGGAQNCMLLLLEEIDRERFTPHLATQPGQVAKAARALGYTRRPLVWHVHDILTPNPYVRWLARRCRSAIAVSQAVAAPLPCGDKVRLIHNGVRAGDFAGDRRAQAARLRRAWGIPALAGALIPCRWRVRAGRRARSTRSVRSSAGIR